MEANLYMITIQYIIMNKHIHLSIQGGLKLSSQNFMVSFYGQI